MTFLLIEFLDELVFGLTEAAWPLFRSDLGLNYLQIGIALSLPGLIANGIEPFLFILGDSWRRRTLILAGGLAFAFSLALTALSHSFIILVLSFVIFNPASGVFIGLSQATLMDADVSHREQNMARWTLAGSLGVLLGSLLLGGVTAWNQTWRVAYWVLAGFTFLAWMAAYHCLPDGVGADREFPSVRSFLDNLRSAASALKDWGNLRWLILLEFSDLMLDVFLGFLALYLVEVMRFAVPESTLVLAVYSGLGLLSNAILIPVLGKIRGSDYLHASALVVLILFPLFLLASGIVIKLVLLGLLGISVTGWYSVLKAGQFSALPGQSGTAQALNNVSGFAGKLLPLGIGWAAQAFGLATAMWILMAGPVALLLGLPRRQTTRAL